MNSAVMFSKASDNWSTPQDFYDRLHAEFKFTLDGAASAENTKCARWLGPGSKYSADALSVKPEDFTFETVFVNPPYSLAKKFIAWAELFRQGGNQIVMLLPSRTDTIWWHQYIYCRAVNDWHAGIRVRFLKGRLKFGGASNSAPFPSVVVIFRPI